MKVCKKCNVEKSLTEYYHYKGKPRGWCKRCDLINTLIHQRIFKEKCVEYKGGECEFCGYKDSFAAMDFHHKDPKEKEFGIAQARNRKFDEKTKKELDKCLLLCSNCHREEHEKEDYDSLKELWAWYEERREKSNLKKKIHKICECGKLKSLKSNMCRECRNYKYLQRNIQTVLSRLKENNYNWTLTAKEFDLSDNGLRKFVKSKGYDPKTIKEII